MAKYNVSAPEPQTFCPIPSILKCDDCDPLWPKQPTIYPISPKLYGCSACRPRQNHCINNNKPLPVTESCQYDTFEYCNYFSNERTPKIPEENYQEDEKRNTQITEKKLITFHGSPSKNSCQSQYRLPVRTPPICIRKKGPRSPCQEYVSTYSFDKEKKKEKQVEETVIEPVDPTSTENKTSKSPTKSGRKSNKTKKSIRSEDTVPVTEHIGNVSGNKPLSIDEIDSSIDSNFSNEGEGMHASRKKSRGRTSTCSPRSVLLKTNLSPIKREHSRSPSKSISRKKTTASPGVSSIITNTDNNIYSERRCSYSPSSKSFFPSFLALTQEAHASNRVKVSTPSKACYRQPSPKTDNEHSATLKMNPVNLLSGNNAKMNFSHVTGNIPKYYRAKLSEQTYAHKKIDYSYQNLKALKAEQNCQKDPNINYNLQNLKALNAEQNFQKDFNETSQSRVSRLENESGEDVADTNDIIETESSTILPKVESTTTLVEKYNSIEVSTNGMLVQSQNKIFDYISAGNSTATNASVKEDPSLSTIDDIVAEDFVNTDKDNIQSTEEPIASTSVDPITDHGTDIDEMSMGVSKINRAHGDDRDQPLGVVRATRSSGLLDKTKPSDGTNKDQKELGLKPQVETFADRIGLENCAFICMAGESSVDPIEYGAIGESAVDDPERIKQSNDIAPSTTAQCNRSNNKPIECTTTTIDENLSENDGLILDGDDDEIEAEIIDCEVNEYGELNKTNNNADEEDDPQKPEIVGTGMDADTIDQGVTQQEERSSSLLHQLLSNSGVRWTQVNEATEDDIKILKEGKATLIRKAREAATDDKQKIRPECVPIPMNKGDDSKPTSEILLKPGVIETLEAKADHQ